MTMRKALILLGLLLSQPVWAEWLEHRVDGAGTAKECTVYIDPITIRKTASGRRIWILYDCRVEKRNILNNKSYKSEKWLHEYDCDGDRWRPLGWSQFSGPMGSGEPIFSASPSEMPQDWDYVEPGSKGAVTHKLICRLPAR
jgi:hypothetical protein